MEKAGRVLTLFYRLINGERIKKIDFAKEFNITERSVDRDIQTIRIILDEVHASSRLLFNSDEEIYSLSCKEKRYLGGVEAVLLATIVLGSRSLCRAEAEGLVQSILTLLPVHEKHATIEAIREDLQEYVEPVHKQALMKMQWDLYQCIRCRQKIQICYLKNTGEEVKRKVMPMDITFSEFYFYLIAFIDKGEYNVPAFFRLDRINSFDVLSEYYERKITKNYSWARERKALQFMYAGKVMEVTLRCKQTALEAFRDRLPNHRIINKIGEETIIKARVYGEGFFRWVLMQGESVEILAPQEARKKFREILMGIQKKYQDLEGV